MDLPQPPSLVIRAILKHYDLVSIPNAPVAGKWPCYTGMLPEGGTNNVPRDAVLVSDTQGVKDGKTPRGNIVFERPGVAVIVRSTKYLEGWALANALIGRLDEVLRLGVDANNYLYVIPNVVRGPLASLGADPRANQRQFFFSVDTHFVMKVAGPYTEWGNEEEALYTAMYHLHQLIHVDMPTFIGTNP